MSAVATVIPADNSLKDSFNQAKLENLSETDLEIFTIDKIPEGTPSALIENLNAKSQSSTGDLARCLLLKEGARVMLTVNIDLSDRLVNGQLGTVDNIVFTESEISKIYLKFDDSLVSEQVMCSDFYSNLPQVVRINRVESHIYLTRKNNLHVICTTQFPLNACTIHKVQSLTIANPVVILDLKEKQKSFIYDQLYVVLSRAKSLLGLAIVENLKNKFFKAHSNAIKEYETLRSASNDLIDKRSDSSQNVITLLNIRSVCRHIADFFTDERLNQSPIICFTETKTSENVHIPLPNFVSDSCMMVRRDISDKFKSFLTLHNKHYFECIHFETFNGFMSLVLKSKVSSTEISLLLAYCKIAMEEEHFSCTLRYLIISTKYCFR